MHAKFGQLLSDTSAVDPELMSDQKNDIVPRSDQPEPPQTIGDSRVIGTNGPNYNAMVWCALKQLDALR